MSENDTPASPAREAVALAIHVAQQAHMEAANEANAPLNQHQLDLIAADIAIAALTTSREIRDYDLQLLVAVKKALFRVCEDPTLEDARSILDAARRQWELAR